VIHFDFDDRYQDELVVGSAISRREGFIWSVVGHLIVIVLLSQFARFGFLIAQPQEPELQAAVQPPQESPRFVYIQPLVERPPEPPRARPEFSDQDRRAQTPERAEAPRNTLPLSRGNTTERVVSPPDAEQARGEPQNPPAPPEVEPSAPQLDTRIARASPNSSPPRRPTTVRRPPAGVLGDAVRNLQRYAENTTFNNPQGGSDPGQQIQFDSKGIDFGPWLRRFVAQVKRNWFVPLAAMNFRGHVVLQFYVHRSGAITDIRVVQPSDIDSFNRAAFNAISGSNPTEPLPPEYPEDSVLFTVTFYYNEPVIN
jgi:TonB family protein